MFAECKKRPDHPGSGSPASMSEGRTNGMSVLQTGVPVPSSVRCQVEQVPHGRQQVDAALGDVVGHPGMTRVEVPGRPVGVQREDRYGRVLVALLVLAFESELEAFVHKLTHARFG